MTVYCDFLLVMLKHIPFQEATLLFIYVCMCVCVLSSSMDNLFLGPDNLHMPLWQSSLLKAAFQPS